MASGNISLVEKDELGDVDFNEDMTEPLREPPPMPWLLLWSLHYYILGIVYFCLMCYALYSIAQHFRRTTGPKKVSNIQSCIFAIKLLLVIFGFSRALYMYLYLHFWYAKTPPWKITRNILANLGFPCLTGGFGLMCLILYEASRLKARSSSKVLHNKWIMISIIVFHFVAVIFAVTAIELLDSYVLMLLICHGFFVVWGLLLIVTFVVFATTLSKAERKSSGVLAEMKEKESVSYGGVSVTSTYQNFSNQSTPKTEKSDRFTPARDQNVLDDVDGGSVTSNDGNETPRCGENPTGMGTTDHKLEGRHGFEGGAKDGTNGVGRAGGDGQGSVREGRNNGKVSYVTDGPSYNSTSPSADTEGAGGSRFVRFRSMMFDRFSTKKLVPNKSRMAFRAKLTRKVMRIAKVTAILSTVCVVLNSFAISRGILGFYKVWYISQTGMYIFNTVFRLVELGQGFTMAYFTTQSISKSSNTKQTFLQQAKKRKNTPFPSKIGNVTTATSGTALEIGDSGKN